jgi:glucose-6-phosphate 1-epimerase
VIIRLAAADGASAEIDTHGAQVTSWIPADGVERLFLSSATQSGPGSTTRGGVPVIFPQFSGEGPLPKHGFARRMEWQMLEQSQPPSGARAVLQLRDDEASRLIWPHAFQLELAVAVGGSQLSMALTATNNSREPLIRPESGGFTFTGALHTYLRVADIGDTLIAGLGSRPYLDTVGGRVPRMQSEDELSFTGETDRIYFDAPVQVIVQEKLRQITVEAQGFTDVVVWNPWAELGARLADMEPDGYRRMLCVEAAVIGRPVSLLPGESWRGLQRLTA